MIEQKGTVGFDRIAIMEQEKVCTAKVCIPGSFDPPTNGHIRLIQRASALFGEVTVFVSTNAVKFPLVTAEEKRILLTDALRDFPNVRVELLSGLLADTVVKGGFHAIVKGVRNAGDFSYEYELFEINNSIGKTNYHKAIETIFLPAEKETVFLSSTMVRELIKYNADYSAFVPNAALLRSMLEKK